MKYRRGLSSVIGMIFLVVVLTSVLGYFTYGIHLVEQVNDQVITKGIESVDKSREHSEITNVRIDAGKFNLTVQNTGEIPIKFTRLWVDNVTDNSWPLQNFTINKIVTPKQVITNIGQDVNLYALDSQAYSMKLITQRGNGKEISINSPNQERLDLKLIALPETVPDKFRTTLLLTVTNNMTNQNTLLNFHTETDLTPNGAFQMYSGDPDSGGTTISVETDNPNFFTNNGTSVKIPAGMWNASLTYFSAPFPDSLMDNNANNMVLHLELNGNPEDSTENTSGHTLGSSSHRPTFQSAGGPHTSGAFSFDGNDYIQINTQASNDIKKAPDATSLWFKAINGINNKQILYRASQSNNDEYYEIGIDANHNIYFEFVTQKNNTPTKCISSGFDYENNRWQHLVAVRPTDHACQLYLNATLINTSSLGNGDSDIHVDGIFVGAKDTSSNSGFNGIIDDILHWDDYSLNSGEITDLKNTNYGNAAHLVTFYMNKTDQNGIFVSNIATDLNYPLKFLDGKKNGSFLNSFNYSKPIEGWINFTDTQRLVFDMQFKSGLDMDMRIDDTSMTGNPSNSFLQTPYSEQSFQSYLTIIGSQSNTFRIYNAGPETAWITFDKTRLTFDHVSNPNTYASLILQANGTDVTSNQDSKAFPALTTMNLTFSSAKNPPATSGSVGIIPPGNYVMKMHIEGYDVNGGSISKTVNFGTVIVK
ncbi:MAG: LamG domain-containing protein [Nitrosarchaeum sp.]|nr:LamG domain-containing protein [Nitrosarchaeum sp.]